MDILTNILDTLRMEGSLYFRTELTSPWGVFVPPEPDVARFHIVVRGQCVLRVEGSDDSITMSNGDIIIIPHGAAHHISDSPDTPSRPLNEVLSEVEYTGSGPLVYGGGGFGCTLVCGQLKYDNELDHPLLDKLPPILHVPGDENYNRVWLDNALGFIAQEAAAQQPGALAIIDRLSEIIFIQVLRAYIDISKSQVPFIAALKDEQISRALREIHNKPDYYWKAENLGKIVGMSRASFFNKFTELVGMAPHQYISFVRMQLQKRTKLSWTYTQKNTLRKVKTAQQRKNMRFLHHFLKKESTVNQNIYTYVFLCPRLRF